MNKYFYILLKFLEKIMNSSIIVIIVFSAFYLGYKYYSRYISQKIFELEETNTTPAHEFEDGIDFVPTNKHILFGHHFTSIAGAAPIIGPCIAAYWGWLPAILWVVLGTIFMGAQGIQKNWKMRADRKSAAYTT